MARIIWTPAERALVTNTLISYLKSNGQTSEHVTRPGWFAFYMQQAQAFLPWDRKRPINAPATLPWLLPAVRVALGEAAPPVGNDPTDIATFVRANLQAVIAELEKTHVVVERTACVQHKIHRAQSTKQRQLRVLVVGVLPAQGAELSERWGQKLDLRFWYSDDSAAHSTLPTVDYVIGITSFLSHSLGDKLRDRYRARYYRVIGAISSVERILEGITVNGKEAVA